MIKTITITITGEEGVDLVEDKISTGIWDALHDVGGIPVLDPDGEACGKMNVYGVQVEVQTS